MKGFATQAIHGVPGQREKTGALRPPLFDSAAFEADSAGDLEMAFKGRLPRHTYSRMSNPTVDEFESRIKLLSGGYGVLALSSGMAAIANTVMALCESGGAILTSRHLFSNTLSLFESTLGRWGLSVKYADMLAPGAVSEAIDGRVRLVFLESITNPQLEVADVARIVREAGEKKVPVVLDNTLTTPYLFRSRDAGVAVEILSSTKYITGGATGLGGLIIDNGTFDWKASPVLAEEARRSGPGALLSRLRREVFRNLGSCMAPHNAWLQILGLETMALRIDKSCANALLLANFLSGHPKVVSVNYPGLIHSPSHAVAKAQFRGRYNGILTFNLGGKPEAFRFMDALSVVRRATNVNDNKSLCIHPASTLFHDTDPALRESLGVSETLIRFSAGIEDAEDLLEDLNRSLEAL